MKTAYIDIEGADLCGKTSLMRTTFRNSNYSKFLCFHDRGILTHYIYNKHFNRYPDQHEMWKREVIDYVAAQANGIVILTANETVLEERWKKRGGDNFFKLLEIIDINNAYNDFFIEHRNLLYPNMTVIDTSYRDLDEVFEMAKSTYQFIARLNGYNEHFLNG